MFYKFDGRKPNVGKDSYISETAIVIGDVIIWDNCYIGHGAILRWDCGRIEIGDGTAVEEGVIILAYPEDTNKIEKMVTIGHGAIVHGNSAGNKAVIGMGAIVSIRSVMGEYAIISEGAVVKRNHVIPLSVVVAGNPAKVVRDILPEDKEFWDWGK